MPFSNQTTRRALVSLAALAGLCALSCRPHMLLIYQMKSEKPDPWKILPEAEDTLRAVHQKNGLEIRVLLAGRKFMQRQSIRMMRSPDSGEYDEQIVRIIARNSTSAPMQIDFSRFVIESAGKTIRPLDAAAYDRLVYAKGRLDYNFYFGQKQIGQFGLTVPDWILSQEEDTASPAEKAKRNEEGLKRGPWARPEILPGEIHAGFLLFPRLDIRTDYVLRLDQINPPVPPLSFQIQMLRRLSSEDEPEISVDARKEIIEEEEWMRRMNEDFLAMHRQIRNHDDLRQEQEQKQKTAPESAVPEKKQTP